MLQCTFFKWTEFHVDVNKFHSPESYLETRLVPFKNPLGNVLNTLATIAMPWHCGVGVLHMQTPLRFSENTKIKFGLMSDNVLLPIPPCFNGKVPLRQVSQAAISVMGVQLLSL